MTGGRFRGRLDTLPLPAIGTERVATLCSRHGCRIEHIVSNGHRSTPGFWYDQSEDEWVGLLSGRAVIEFADGETAPLAAGDWLMIPAGRRHRVADTGEGASWLVVFLPPTTDHEAER